MVREDGGLLGLAPGTVCGLWTLLAMRGSRWMASTGEKGWVREAGSGAVTHKGSGPEGDVELRTRGQGQDGQDLACPEVRGGEKGLQPQREPAPLCFPGPAVPPPRGAWGRPRPGGLARAAVSAKFPQARGDFLQGHHHLQ